jgi:hypothetical protein
MSTSGKSSCSILIMRDDNTVSTFRLRTFWFKILAVLLLVILGTSGASIYGLLYFKEKYLLTAQNLEARQNELNETKVRLQDHNNLAVLPYGDPSPGNIASSPSYALNNVVQPFHSGSEQDSAGSAPASGRDATQPQLSGSAQNAGQRDSPERNAQRPSGGSGGTPALEDVQALLGQSGPAASAGLNPDDAEPDGSATRPIQISNVSTSAEAGNRLRINFDITNVPQKTTLAGNCSVFATTRQGAEVELAPLIRGSLSFRISRFRSMHAVLSLPDRTPLSEFVKLRINVHINGLPPYWRLFPLGS